MAADVATFKTRFSEFATTPDPTIAAVLASVELRVSSTYGAIREEVVLLEAADTLSAGTQGRNARTTKDQTGGSGSTYATKLAELQNTHALTRRTRFGL